MPNVNPGAYAPIRSDIDVHGKLYAAVEDIETIRARIKKRQKEAKARERAVEAILRADEAKSIKDKLKAALAAKANT
jgi:hypothetical protein